MKKLVFWAMVALFMAAATRSFAQKETFDVVSYSVPKGWKKEVKENGVQLYTGNDKTGEYSMALIIKSTASAASASESFTGLWEKLVKGTVTVSGDPTMAAPTSGKGWEIVSGQGYYTDGANKGMVTLVTATGGGKVAAVVLMANTDKYQTELQGFLHSLEMSEVVAAQGGVVQGGAGGSGSGAVSGGGAAGSSVVGIWESNMAEMSGMRFANGSPMVTAGYFRKAYTFNADGTYLFLEKDFSAYTTTIFFAYETGTWAIDGNRLTITPVQGKNEDWSKSASGRNNEWGSLLKTSVRKLEKISYAFEFHYYSGMNETDLLLKLNKPTERDGRQSNDNNGENVWNYKPPYTPGKSVIDLPPGEKIGGVKAGGGKTDGGKMDAGGRDVLAGKIWEGTSKEKFAGGTMNGHYTGGFFTYQYRFGVDGTYRFAYVGASAYTDANVLQWEKGTYSVSGDQLMLQVQYMEGNHANAFVVQGAEGTSYYFETTAEKSVRLPLD